MKFQRLQQDPSPQRRRLLRFLTLGTWGVLGSLTFASHGPNSSPAAGLLVAQVGTKERPIREADFYRPHDLAG